MGEQVLEIITISSDEETDTKLPIKTTKKLIQPSLNTYLSKCTEFPRNKRIKLDSINVSSIALENLKLDANTPNINSPESKVTKNNKQTPGSANPAVNTLNANPMEPKVTKHASQIPINANPDVDTSNINFLAPALDIETLTISNVDDDTNRTIAKVTDEIFQSAELGNLVNTFLDPTNESDTNSESSFEILKYDRQISNNAITDVITGENDEEHTIINKNTEEGEDSDKIIAPVSEMVFESQPSTSKAETTNVKTIKVKPIQKYLEIIKEINAMKDETVPDITIRHWNELLGFNFNDVIPDTYLERLQPIKIKAIFDSKLVASYPRQVFGFKDSAFSLVQIEGTVTYINTNQLSKAGIEVDDSTAVIRVVINNSREENQYRSDVKKLINKTYNWNLLSKPEINKIRAMSLAEFREKASMNDKERLLNTITHIYSKKTDFKNEMQFPEVKNLNLGDRVTVVGRLIQYEQKKFIFAFNLRRTVSYPYFLYSWSKYDSDKEEELYKEEFFKR